MKKILKSHIIPIINYFYYKLPKYNLRKYWLKNKSNFNFDDELKKMIDFFIQSKSYESMSGYWNYLNIKNLKQIKEKNIENYSSTIAINYHTFIDVSDEQVEQSILNVQNILISENVNLYKKQINMSFAHSMKYNNLTYLIISKFKKIKLARKIKLFI